MHFGPWSAVVDQDDHLGSQLAWCAAWRCRAPTIRRWASRDSCGTNVSAKSVANSVVGNVPIPDASEVPLPSRDPRRRERPHRDRWREGVTVDEQVHFSHFDTVGDRNRVREEPCAPDDPYIARACLFHCHAPRRLQRLHMGYAARACGRRDNDVHSARQGPHSIRQRLPGLAPHYDDSACGQSAEVLQVRRKVPRNGALEANHSAPAPIQCLCPYRPECHDVKPLSAP